MPDTHLEERIAGLEGSYRELTKRIDDLRSEMHRGFDGLRVEVHELKADGRAMFRWTLSLILINWLSLIAGIFLVSRREARVL